MGGSFDLSNWSPAAPVDNEVKQDAPITDDV